MGSFFNILQAIRNAIALCHCDLRGLTGFRALWLRTLCLGVPGFRLMPGPRSLRLRCLGTVASDIVAVGLRRSCPSLSSSDGGGVVNFAYRRMGGGERAWPRRARGEEPIISAAWTLFYAPTQLEPQLLGLPQADCAILFSRLYPFFPMSASSVAPMNPFDFNSRMLTQHCGRHNAHHVTACWRAIIG